MNQEIQPNINYTDDTEIFDGQKCFELERQIGNHLYFLRLRMREKILNKPIMAEEVREINRLLQNLQSAAHALSVYCDDL